MMNDKPRPVLLVTGGRDYADVQRLTLELDCDNPGLVIHGGARGADALADTWARGAGVHVLRCDALWDVYRKAAGSKRNAVMVEVCKRLGGSVLAFPGGAGTADCVRRAEAAGLTVRRVGA